MTTMSRWAAGAVAATVIAALAGCAASGPVVSIDERAVTDAELRFQLSLAAPTVENRVAQGELTTDAAPAALADAALAATLDDAVLFRVAHENGLIPFDDFDGLLADRERENAARAESVAQGEIVYGLTSFTPEEYHSRAVTTIRLALAEELGAPGGPLAVSDDEVRAAYEADPGSWAAGVAQYDIELTEIPGAALDAEACATAAANRDVAAVAASCAGSVVSTTTLDGAEQLPAGSPAASILQAAQSIEVGATSDAIPSGDGAALVRLLERRVDPEEALATYRERIRAQLTEKALAAWLEKKEREAVVTVDRTRLDSLSSEGLK